MNCCCENCGWSEIVGSPIMCNYNGHRTWRDECCEAWKPKGKKQQCVKPFHRCNGSEYTLIEDSHFDFCPYCGKPIDWKDGEQEC